MVQDEPPPAPGTQVRVLGQVGATVAGRACEISSPTARALLALLAVDAGRVVPVDRVLTELWGPDAAASRTSTLHVYVSRLRRAFAEAAGPDASPLRLVHRAPGYLLELPDGALDAERFARLADAARARVAVDPAEALRLLDEALALVTGEPLGDVVDLLGPATAAEARRLGELVLTARETRVEALLGLGRAADGAQEAERLLHLQPLRESVLALRLLGLYRSGRQSEALRAYDDLRERLADELGVDPGPALRRLHVQLLQQDSALDWRPPDAPSSAPAAPVPVSGPGRRAAQVADVVASVERSSAGAGGLWLVSGEAGIGKTRLVSEVAVRARARGVAVALGRAQESTEAAPYWTWGGVLRDLPELPRSVEVDVLLGAAPAGSGAPLTRAAVHDAVARLLTDRARDGGPLLLVLEDLHWADAPSLELLSTLAERVGEVPLVVLGTWRVEDVGPAGAFGAFLARMARVPGIRRAHLDGLERDEARALLVEELGWEPPEATTAAVADRTGGNPFFLQELARLVRSSGDAPQAWEQVPGTVRDVLLHRVAGLAPAAQRLLDVASVHGRECDLALLEQVGGLPADSVDEGLADAVRSGLVVEAASAVPVLRFRHALVREALYARLGARARMRLHAELGTVLAARGDEDEVDAVAAHLLAGGDLADAATTLRAVVAAADRALGQLALDHAQQLLERGLAVLPRAAPGTERDRLELALQARSGTVVATRQGFAAPAARQALERAGQLALLVPPDDDALAALYRRYLWLLMGGDFAAVQVFADELLAHAGSCDGEAARDRLLLLGRLARGSVLWCLGQAAPAVEELQLALRLAEPADPALDGHARPGGAFGDPGVRVRMFLCHALASAGRRAEAVVVADQMVELARQSGPADESDALATRGMMHAVFREPEPARADGVEGQRLARLLGAELLGCFADLNEGWGAALSGVDGLVEAAVERVRSGAAGYRATGTRMHDPIVWTMLAEAEAAAGHADRAAAAARAGLDALAATGSCLWVDRLQALAD